jgi:hypothetical protein
MTCIELLAGIFLIAVPLVTGQQVADSFGLWAGVGAGVVAAGAYVGSLRFLYREKNRRDLRRRGEFREIYRRIYRVVDLPSDKRNIVTPAGAEIRAGDYGWEARPMRNNGLIYLQGLTKEWCEVWWAGFSPEQIEYVGPKPVSQYDWLQFIDEKTPCPFPVQRQEPIVAMGPPN